MDQQGGGQIIPSTSGTSLHQRKPSPVMMDKANFSRPINLIEMTSRHKRGQSNLFSESLPFSRNPPETIVPSPMGSILLGNNQYSSIGNMSLG